MSSIFNSKILKSPFEQLVNLQTSTKKGSVEPSSEVIESIKLEPADIFHGERPIFKKITLQQAYANGEFIGVLKDLFEKQGLDFEKISIAIYLSASIPDESIKNVFCEAANEYENLNGV
jgi:hypothetical protein